MIKMMNNNKPPCRVFKSPKRTKAPIDELDPEYREAVFNLPTRDIRPYISLYTLRNDIFVIDGPDFIEIFHVATRAAELGFPRLEFDDVIIPAGKENYLFFLMRATGHDICVCRSELDTLHNEKYGEGEEVK